MVSLLEDRAAPVSENEILSAVNVRPMRLKNMLKILEVEGAVERAGSKWLRTLAPWRYDEDRVHRVTAARRAEQAAMDTYGRTDECLMAFLLRQLDDPDPVRAAVHGVHGRVALDRARCRPGGEGARTPPLGRAADRAPAPVAQRDGRAEGHPDELRVEPGRSLSVLDDGGWGGLVRSGSTAEEYADALVEASAD